MNKQDQKISNLYTLNALTSLLTIGVIIYATSLYVTTLTQKAEIAYLQAFTKHIETKGLEHWYNSQKEPNLKVAKVTAYSCGGINTDAELEMNCPSLKKGQPKTANGTTPLPYKTMACDRSLLGKSFDLKGIGTVTCTDLGGAIKGDSRFDLYVYDINEAMKWGTQYVIYEEL